MTGRMRDERKMGDGSGDGDNGGHVYLGLTWVVDDKTQRQPTEIYRRGYSSHSPKDDAL